MTTGLWVSQHQSHAGQAINMVQMLCKVWGVGMFSIVALTTSNILLTLRLMQGRDDGSGGGGCGGIPPIPDSVPHSWTAALSSTNHSEYLAFLRAAAINTAPAAPTTKGSPAGEAERAGAEKSGPPLVVVGSGFKVDEARGRWDARRRYKTHDHVFTGPHYGRLTRSSPVCLATQTSVDRLFWLTQVARYWSAPMSVAVFTPDVEYAIARAYLSYLVTCFPFLGEKVSFHFTYPRDHLPKDVPLVINHLEDRCDQPLGVLKELLKHRDSRMLSWRERMPYPRNVMEKVAPGRHVAQSGYFSWMWISCPFQDCLTPSRLFSLQRLPSSVKISLMVSLPLLALSPNALYMKPPINFYASVIQTTLKTASSR
ncbi:uncharacterized protein LOC125032097 [Penaeus chinensis]|uniref:uncharacterized protein LOC125032097 n=1 Tax=Penaeus chinensis TaxID=139456 RepID=UPI001FB78265|nr:uncharacterized protein LOC125032097 [Penaeus chinensis]